LESRYEEQKQQADERPRANVPGELQKKEGAFAQAPREADARTDAPAAGAVARAAPEPAPPAAPPPATALEEEAAASAAPAKPDAAVAEPRQQEAVGAKRPAPRDATSDLASGEVDAMGARGRVVRPAPAGTAAAKLLASEAEWQRLETTRPRTPEEWRRLREDWRRFVTRDPEGTLADAARLRMIEAGRSAWRASSDPADEAAFREDAAAYLEREAAPQKDRVRRLLADPAAR